jgi:hypothetical protein
VVGDLGGPPIRVLLKDFGDVSVGPTPAGGTRLRVQRVGDQGMTEAEPAERWQLAEQSSLDSGLNQLESFRFAQMRNSA